MENELDRLVPRDMAKSQKIVRLWAIIELNYPGEEGIGQEASDRLRALIGNDAVIALFQITGFCLADPDKEAYEEMAGMRPVRSWKELGIDF